MDDFISEWKQVKKILEDQIGRMEAPIGVPTTNSDDEDTTEESKKRIGQCIKELDALLEKHG